MDITVDTRELKDLTEELGLLDEQISKAMRKTVKDTTANAFEFVTQPNGNYPTSYRDTKKLPLKETKERVSSGITNTSEAFYYFEYGTGTGTSKGALNGRWFVPVEKANLSQYYPLTQDGKCYIVKPQKAQRMFKKTSDLIDRELEPMLNAYLKKEIKNG